MRHCRRRLGVAGRSRAAGEHARPLETSRTGCGRTLVGRIGSRLPRPPAALDHRSEPRGRPAVRLDRRRLRDHPERRDLQLPLTAFRARAGRSPVSDAVGHRGPARGVRPVGRGLSRTCFGDVRLRGMGWRRQETVLCARPCWGEAVLLRGRGRHVPLRVRAQGPAPLAESSPRAELRGSRRLSHVRLHTRPQDRVGGSAKASSGACPRGRARRVRPSRGRADRVLGPRVRA